jgi:hypothetical protein
MTNGIGSMKLTKPLLATAHLFGQARRLIEPVQATSDARAGKLWGPAGSASLRAARCLSPSFIVFSSSATGHCGTSPATAGACGGSSVSYGQLGFV